MEGGCVYNIADHGAVYVFGSFPTNVSHSEMISCNKQSHYFQVFVFFFYCLDINIFQTVPQTFAGTDLGLCHLFTEDSCLVPEGKV